MQLEALAEPEGYKVTELVAQVEPEVVEQAVPEAVPEV